ncbi:YwmB family TATA-box binding protein [Amphibacillus indicireducens]|uniref:TATA-box binding protein n=1 Tax=Amphibacillus indicireducens TaxID=1076330 RepID=A0ABP7VKM0_9BACI
MKIMIHSLLVLMMIQLIMPMPTKVETPLDELIQFADQHDYPIEFGELTIKETFTTSETEQIKLALIRAGFQKTNEVNQYERKLNDDLHEIITIIDSIEQVNQAVNYQLLGNVNHMNRTDDYAETVKSLISTIYTTEKQQYACLKISSHDMMLSGYFFAEIQKNLNYQEIDRIEEPDLTVISGYTTQFNQQIPYGNEQMNVQISVRQRSNQEKQIMIGTPILMTEY